MQRAFRMALLLCLGVSSLVLIGCDPPNPLDRLLAELRPYPEFSILLEDMKTSGTFSTDYFHRYKVVIGEEIEGSEDLSFRDELGDWERVPKAVFRQYEPYLGMVILSKDASGPVQEAIHPPGYQYVGNPRYGQWRSDSSGGSFWEFYGKYALLSHVFGSFNRPIYRGDWDSYSSSRRSNRPYFGPNREFGTQGTYTRQSNPTFFERQKLKQQRSRQSFSEKVKDRSSRNRRSSMSRSRSRSSSRGGK